LNDGISIQLDCSAHMAAAFALHKGSLIFQNAQSLPQSLDLFLSPPLSLLVCLRLSDAPLLDFVVVFHDGTMLRLGRFFVCRQLRQSFTQSFDFLRFELHILLLQRFCYLVFLCSFVIFRLCISLLGVFFGQILCEVRFAYF